MATGDGTALGQAGALPNPLHARLVRLLTELRTAGATLGQTASAIETSSWFADELLAAEARGARRAAREIDFDHEVFTADDGHLSIRQHGKRPEILLGEWADRQNGVRP